jgi:hypothetical protein
MRDETQCCTSKLISNWPRSESNRNKPFIESTSVLHKPATGPPYLPVNPLGSEHGPQFRYQCDTDD